MAMVTSGQLKRCVTCEYWNGTRETGPSGRDVRYRLKITDSDTGVCTNKVSTRKGRPVRGSEAGWLQVDEMGQLEINDAFGIQFETVAVS